MYSFIKVHIILLDYTGPAVIGQFTVKNWTQKIDFVPGSSTKRVLRIKIDFYRNFFGIFTVTYLPTILMNILNQATNYLTGDSKHELIVTVNITSMMVLASIYLSVSASLRKTQDIKPVEVWLLFNLAYPFLVILVNIVINVSFKYFSLSLYIMWFTRLETQLSEREWRPSSKFYG